MSEPTKYIGFVGLPTSKLIPLLAPKVVEGQFFFDNRCAPSAPPKSGMRIEMLKRMGGVAR